MAYSIKNEVIFRDGVEIGVLVAPGDVDYTGDAEKYHPHVVKMLKKEGLWETDNKEPIAAPPMEKADDTTTATRSNDSDSNVDTDASVPGSETAAEGVDMEPADDAKAKEVNEVPEPDKVKALTVRERVVATEQQTGVKAPVWKHWLGDHNPEIIAYLQENEK